MGKNLELIKDLGVKEMEDLFVEVEQKSKEMCELARLRREEAFSYFESKKRDAIFDGEYLKSIENLRLCEIIKDLCYQIVNKKVERNLKNAIAISTTISFIVDNIEKNISCYKFIEDIIKNRNVVDLGCEVLSAFHTIKFIMTFDPNNFVEVD